jgi:hypothetical protein
VAIECFNQANVSSPLILDLVSTESTLAPRKVRGESATWQSQSQVTPVISQRNISFIFISMENPSPQCPKPSKCMVLLVKDPSPVAFAGPGSYAAAEKPHALIAYLAASVAK